jgi:VPDSG-CTERM motif
MKHPILSVASISLLAVISANAIPVTVEEVSVSPCEAVSITSSTLGTTSGYAGLNTLLVNGIPVPGFCIDPFHLSLPGPQSYNTEALSIGPKSPGGPMGLAAATEVEQLWWHYFSPNMSATDAAGLQIAIWDVVAGSGFSLHQDNDYGASAMLSWWSQNQGTALAADLIAVTGPGQDYLIPDAKPPQSVPDGGATVLLLGGTLGGLAMLRRRLCEA